MMTNRDPYRVSQEPTRKIGGGLNQESGVKQKEWRTSKAGSHRPVRKRLSHGRRRREGDGGTDNGGERGGRRRLWRDGVARGGVDAARLAVREAAVRRSPFRISQRQGADVAEQ